MVWVFSIIFLKKLGFDVEFEQKGLKVRFYVEFDIYICNYIYMCVCVCMYIYIYVCIYIHMEAERI